MLPYQKVREIGRGGAATVWLAVADDGREVALKQLDVARPDMRARIVHEGEVQRALRHPNIVQVLDALELDGRPTLILELVRDGTLATWAPGKDCAAIEAVFRGLLAGLGAAHAAGLVHRDLKPSNILMDGDVPKIADFGLARALDGGAGDTRTGMALGTPWYMPPEQFRDPRSVDRRADLWALGVVLYEMLAGRPPLLGDDVVALHDRATRRAWTPIREVRRDVTPGLAAALDALLQPSLADRAADCGAVLALLDGAAAGGATAGRWRLIEELPSRPPVRRHRVSAEVAGVAKSIPVDADRAELSRFEREERLMSELSHPRVPAILDRFYADGRQWVVRAAVPGRSLAEEIAARRPDLDELLGMLDAILGTVAELHALVPPVVHRGLDPDAIVVRPEGAWIVEFATARGDTDGRLADGTFVGSFGYMAPEQFGGESGRPSDVRAIGAIAAWMLTRRHPRTLERDGVLDWRPHTSVPEELATWVDALLAPDPASRPDAETAQARLAAVRRRLASQRGAKGRAAATPASSARPPERPARGRAPVGAGQWPAGTIVAEAPAGSEPDFAAPAIRRPAAEVVGSRPAVGHGPSPAGVLLATLIVGLFLALAVGGALLQSLPSRHLVPSAPPSPVPQQPVPAPPSRAPGVLVAEAFGPKLPDVQRCLSLGAPLQAGTLDAAFRVDSGGRARDVAVIAENDESLGERREACLVTALEATYVGEGAAGLRGYTFQIR